MTISARICAPDEAIAELAAAVDELKAGDRLRPVVVAVPSNASGVMVRRALGRSDGLVGVDTVTLNRLCELIAGPALAAEQRVPMSTPVVDLTVEQVLDDHPGSYEAVAAHASTIVALRDVHRELRRAGTDAADTLAERSVRAREAVRVSRAVTERLHSRWYDEADLFERATTALGDGIPDRLGRLVVHLPRRLAGLPVRFLAELGRRAEVRVVVASVGSAAADAETAALLGDLGLPLPSPRKSAAQPVRVVSTTDADDEVQVACRSIVDAARAGTAFERMALLWPVARPYARLVEHHLDQARIPWNGTPGTSTVERLVPRLVLDLLDIDRRGLRRRDLFEVLADLPHEGGDGRRLPSARWERISRRAGIARDDDWEPRLAALADDEHDGHAASELSEFVRELRGDLGPADRRATWAEWAEWCDQQVRRWVGRHNLQRLDDPEYRAFEALGTALDRLRHLDPVGEPVTRHRFRTTLEAELDDLPGRRGRVGGGVNVGPLTSAEGLDIDVAVVLGGAEGTLPPMPGADPLLSDADRTAAGLAGSEAYGELLLRSLLWTWTNAATTVTVPRGDLRSTSRSQPSRWIAPFADDPRLHVVDSHAAGLAATEFPVSPSEHRLRARYGHRLAGHPLSTAAGVDDDVAVRRGLALRHARASATVTPYDGDLTGLDVPLVDRAVSPSRLEAWAACPHAYFVQHVLGVKPIEEPDDEISITARDRGTAVHEALDRFHRAVIAERLPQPGSDGWTATHADALGAFFDEVCDETERRGRTGRAAYWAVERERMRADLLDWLRHDGALTSERGATVVASEHRFGVDGEVAIALPDGRRIALRGSVDRIDRRADGGLVVTDHKTGRGTAYRGLDEDDPTLGGTAFQLPSYAAAARAFAGDGTASVHAEYGMFSKGDYRRFGYDLTPAVWSDVESRLATVVDGIEAGMFIPLPARPGWRLFTPCVYCEPDHLGTAERWSEWERKRSDPRLARWFDGGDER